MTRGSQAGLASPVGLRSNADQIRRMCPLGSPKRKGGVTTNEAKCRRRRVVRLIHFKAELMPVFINRGAGGISRRTGFEGHVDGPALLVSIPPPTALREACLNGFPRALAGVLPPPPWRRPPVLLGP